MPAVYTIGYGNRSIDDFISRLQRHAIAYLLDVRSIPYSRFNPDFIKARLADLLAAHDIRYVFMGQALGGKPDNPALYDAEGKLDYGKVRASPVYQEGLARVQNACTQNLRVALMCAELHPEQCHRSMLIAPSLEALGIEVLHINAEGLLIPHADLHAPGQLLLFDDNDGNMD